MSIVQNAARFEISSIPGPALRVGLIPAFTTAAEYAEWGYGLGHDGLDLGPAHLLPHSFWSAAVRGYRVGREDAAREGRSALAWNLGHHAGVRGRAPKFPREYGRDEASAYRDGWQAGDAEYRDWLAGAHQNDFDEQPDPYDVEVQTVSENEFREVSEGFTRYPEEEAVEVFGHRAGVIG